MVSRYLFKAPFGMSLLWHISDFYSINFGIFKFLYKSVFSTKYQTDICFVFINFYPIYLG